MHYFSLVEEFLEVSDDELPGDGEEDVSRHGELPRQLPRHLLRLLNRLPPPEVLKQRTREINVGVCCTLNFWTCKDAFLYAAVTCMHLRSIST